jgi:glyoxylase-like metal-dependent hydrolase (beta-lactamase superfamily II)
MRIIPLSEGSFTIDKTKQFVPFANDDILNDRPAGSLLVEIQPFVVVTSKDVLLLDTGLGFESGGELQLHKNMKAAGIDPLSVTKVLVSHLHKDHAGGICMESGNKAGLSLPNAEYFINRNELAYAFEKGLPSYIPRELDRIKGQPGITFTDDKGTIAGYIDYEVTAAHSLYHQVFRIKDGDEIVFFGADDAPQLQQMKHKFSAKYDLNGRKAMELRQQWWSQGENEKWTFLFYHDVKNPIWRFD